MASKFNLLGLLCLALTLILCPYQRAESSPQERIKVGVIVGLTGLAAPNGYGVRNGIALADMNSDGLVEFILEDDNFQPKKAVSAALKLISDDKVAALITFSASTSLAVSAIAESRKIPMLAITPLTNVGANKRFVRTIFVPNTTAVALLLSAANRISGRRVGIITTTQDGLLQIRERIHESIQSEICFEEEVPPGDIDLSSTVTKMLATKPDIFINLTLSPQISYLAKTLYERRFTGEHLGGPPMYNFKEIQAAAGALAGAKLTGPKIDPNSCFLSNYTERFAAPVLPEAIFGYDVAQWIINAVRNRSGIHSILDAAKQTGVAGEYIKSPDNQFEAQGELKVITVAGEVKSMSIEQ